MPSPDRFQEDAPSQPQASEQTTNGGGGGRNRHFDLSVFDQDMSEAESVVLGSTELELDGVGAGKRVQEHAQGHPSSMDGRDAEQPGSEVQREEDDEKTAQQQEEEEEEEVEDIEEEVYDEDFELDEELLEE